MKPPRRSEARPVGDFLPEALKALGVSREVERFTVEEVLRRWMGEGVARHLVGVEVRRGQVTVRVDHPAVAAELNFRREEGLRVLREAVPDGPFRELVVRA